MGKEQFNNAGVDNLTRLMAGRVGDVAVEIAYNLKKIVDLGIQTLDEAKNGKSFDSAFDRELLKMFWPPERTSQGLTFVKRRGPIVQTMDGKKYFDFFTSSNDSNEDKEHDQSENAEWFFQELNKINSPNIKSVQRNGMKFEIELEGDVKDFADKLAKAYARFDARYFGIACNYNENSIIFSLSPDLKREHLKAAVPEIARVLGDKFWQRFIDVFVGQPRQGKEILQDVWTGLGDSASKLRSALFSSS